MNTILAICCQLALLYCALVRGDDDNDKFSLSEATIFNIDDEGNWKLSATHTRQVMLLKYFDAFMIDAYKKDIKDVGNILCFNIEQFHSFIDDTAFLIAKELSQVMRLKFAEKRDAGRLDTFVLATPSDQNLEFLYQYEILKIIQADESGNEIYKSVDTDPQMDISLSVYAVVENEEKTEKRRFVIRGHKANECVLFAIFNRDQFNFVQIKGKSQFALVVVSPDGEGNSAYLALLLNPETTFKEYMKEFVSSTIKVPKTLKTSAKNI